MAICKPEKLIQASFELGRAARREDGSGRPFTPALSAMQFSKYGRFGAANAPNQTLSKAARSTASRLGLVCRSLEARKPQGLGAAERTDRAALV